MLVTSVYVAAAFNCYFFRLCVHSFVIIAFFSFISLSRYRCSVRFFRIILLFQSPFVCVFLVYLCIFFATLPSSRLVYCPAVLLFLRVP